MEFRVGEDTLFYEIEGSGHPVVFLHSMGTDHRSMKSWMEPVLDESSGVQRIYVDIPAHGRSNCHSVRSTQDIVNLFVRFVDEVIPDGRFSLAGHSFGGYLAQGVFSARVERAAGICLIAPVLHLRERTLPEKVVKIKDEACLREVDADIRQAFETLMVYQTRENLETFFNEVQPGRALLDRSFIASNWREDGYFLREDPLGDGVYEHPALFIAGKLDAITGFEDCSFLTNKFSNSTFAVLEDAGHLMTIEKRAEVQSLVKDWAMKCMSATGMKVQL
ncbi:alpha/beta fold hydrolase [Fictibacillus iocasae]|uniref:Alpha/beta fold hydrolase n=1 Tax=Fictibacillus iocasae TaxID=2715437 RepID=A0ABW2NUH5_9BACL